MEECGVLGWLLVGAFTVLSHFYIVLSTLCLDIQVVF